MPESNQFETQFIPHIDEPRFSYWEYLINGIEYCYTVKEMNFREDILALRLSSGIPAEYLQNSYHWFSSDPDNAFVKINADSWVYRPSFRPRDRLSRDDFLWHSVDPKSLQCPVNTIGKFIGDYLKIRNQRLSDEHINQPMNFVLLDVLNILSHMAKDSNQERVKSALHSLQTYLNRLKMKLSAIEGNDRHFINRLCEQKLSKLIMQLELSSDMWVFREKIESLEQSIDYIDLVAQTKMHFSLNSGQANAHVYLADEIEKEEYSAAQFPSMALKKCIKEKQSTSSEMVAGSSRQPQARKVDIGILEDCSELDLIDGLSDDEKQIYLSSHVKIARISEIKKVIKDLKSMLDTSGEVILVHHFSSPFLSFLQQLRSYLQDLQKEMKQLDQIQGANFFKNSLQLQQFEQSNWFKQWVNSAKKLRLEQYNQNSKALEGSLFNLQNMDKLISEALETTGKIELALKDIGSRKMPAISEDFENLQQQLLSNILQFQLSADGVEAEAAVTPLKRLAAKVEKNKQLLATCRPTEHSTVQSCETEADHAVLIQKNLNNRDIPERGDYQLGHCYSVRYESQPAVLCDNETSAALFSASPIHIEHLFSAAPGQLLLVYLMGMLFKNKAMFNLDSSTQQTAAPRYLMPRERIENLTDKLAEAVALSRRAGDLDEDEEQLEMYNDMLKKMATTAFTLEEQDELEKDLDYFISCSKEDIFLPANERFEIAVNEWSPGFFATQARLENSHQQASASQLKLGI